MLMVNPIFVLLAHLLAHIVLYVAYFLFARPVHISRSGHGYISISDGKRSMRNRDNRLGCKA